MNFRRLGALALALLLVQPVISLANSYTNTNGSVSPGFRLEVDGTGTAAGTIGKPLYMVPTAVASGAATAALQTSIINQIIALEALIGEVQGSPTANTALDRLKVLATKLDTLATDLGAPGATVCATDTGSCSSNALQQRIAQRISALIAQHPGTLGQTTKSGSMSVTLASDDDLQAKLGIVTETAPASDTASSGLNGRLQRLAQRLTTLIATDFATSAKQDTTNTDLGAPGSTACATDTGSCSLNALLQRIAQRLTTINTTLGTPFQAGGALGAGSALIGKVGIDQTTPGTTNLIYAQGLRNFVAKGTINNGQTSYSGSAGSVLVIGGLVTIPTGLPAGTIINASTLRVKGLAPNINGGTQWNVGGTAFFDANPTGSTITDNVAISIAAADIAKTISFVAGGLWSGGFGANGVMVLTLAAPKMAVDGSGNIYFALATTQLAVFLSTNVISWQLDGTY